MPEKYFCDVCGKLIVECDTDIDYTGVTLMCDKCSTFLEKNIGG